MQIRELGQRACAALEKRATVARWGRILSKASAYVYEDEDEEDRPSLLGSMAQGALYGGLGGLGAGAGWSGWKGYQPYGQHTEQEPALSRQALESSRLQGEPEPAAQKRIAGQMEAEKQRLGGGPIGSTWKGMTEGEGPGRAGRWGLYGAGAGAALGALRYLLS